MVTRKVAKELRGLQNKADFHQSIWKHNIFREHGHPDMEEEGPEDGQSEEQGLVDWCSNIFVGGGFNDAKELGLRRSQVHGRTRMTETQSRILGTFLPDELFRIIDTEDQASNFVGVVLLGDVSGFTRVCELYSNYKGGAYRLTATLNSYIGSMVELIYEFHGDIMKFSGDAFLAVWRVNKHEYIYNVIHRVVCCALAIQSSLGIFLTKEKLCLRVKLAISSGHMTIKVIGDDYYKSFLVYGPPILEVKMGQDLSEKGDVTLGPAAWGFLSPHNYKFEYTEMGYVKVKFVLYDPLKPKNVTPFITVKPQMKIDIDDKYKYLKKFDLEVEYDDLVFAFEKTVRPSLFLPEVQKYSSRFRSYLVSPVLQQIDADQPLEYLTEMRTVTIMFVNLVPTTTTTNEVIKLVHNAYCTLASIVRISNLGIINKVCLFDKDIMFLIVFGLRGFKHKDETLRCLKSSEVALKVLKAEEGVKSVSIGVTVGLTYCGVVGHPLRKEFTVIGRPVNKAARLMCAFEDKVTCDKAAFLNSALPQSFFTLMPYRKFKGFASVEDIYEFKDVGPLFGYEMAAPILGREEEISKFMEILNGSEYQGVALYGEPRTGKSRLIQEFAHLAGKEGWVSVWAMSGMRKNFQTYVLREIFEKFYGRSSRKREKGINLALKKLEAVSDYLHLLNGFADVHFTPPRTRVVQDVAQQNNATKCLILEALVSVNQKLLIIVEDAEMLMEGSYKMLRDLLSLKTVKVVLTVSHKFDLHEIFTEYFITSNLIYKMYLTNLDPELIPTLACQLMNVKAIPIELCEILKKITNGNPGWIQTCLCTFRDKDILSIKAVTELMPSKMNMMITPDLSLLRKDTDSKENGDGAEIRICFIEKKQDLSEKAIAPFDNIIVTAFDHLEPFEQFVLKCCSVLGLSFERKYLNHVMKHPNPIAVVKAMGRIYRLRFLVCTLINRPSQSGKRPSINRVVEEVNKDRLCCCEIPDDEENEEDLPNYYYCQNPGFPFPTFRETIYDLMPPNQKREFHARALTYVQKLPTKCGRCVEIGKERMETTGVVKCFSYMSITGVTQKLLAHLNERRDCSIQLEYRKDEEDTGVEPPPLKLKEVKKKNKLEVVEEESGSESSMKVEDEEEEEPQRTKSVVDLQSKIAKFFRRLKELKNLRIEQKVTEVKLREKIRLDYPGLSLCKCYSVVKEVYPQLIEHSKISGQFEVCIDYLIQYARILMNYCNFYEALQLMIQANELLPNLRKLIEPPVPELEFIVIWQKVAAALGDAYFHLGMVEQSVNTLSPIIPHTKSRTQVWVDWIYTKLPLVSKYNKKLVLDTLSANAEIHLAITNLYVHHNFWVSAFSSAQKALRTAMVNRQLETICMAYTNMFDIMHQNGLSKKCKKWEKKALQIIPALYVGIDKTEVLAVGRLLNVIIKLRYCRGEFGRVLELTPYLLTVLKQFKAVNASSKCIPFILYSAVCTEKLKDVQVLLESYRPKYKSESKKNKSTHREETKTYCGMCLFLYLNTGITFYENGDIEHCFFTLTNMCSNKLSSIEFPTARSFALMIWLWHLRRREFSAASANAVQDQKIIIVHNLVYQYMTLLQCQLLWLVHRIDEEINVDGIIQHINRKMKKINLATAKIEMSARSRYLHLKAYYFAILKKESQAKYQLVRAYKLAKSHNNEMEMAWITCSRKSWFGPKAEATRERLLNRYLSTPRVGYEEVPSLDWSDIMFPLPLPSYKQDKSKLVFPSPSALSDSFYLEDRSRRDTREDSTLFHAIPK